MEGLVSTWVNSINQVYQQGQRWFDAVGPGVVKFIEHFVGTCFATADNLAGWTTTLVEMGGAETTVALAASSTGGALLITTDLNENDGANLQVQGEAFKLAADKPLYFGIKFQASEATQSDFFAGLAITDVDILGGVTDSVGFKKVDGSTAIQFEVNKNSTATAGNVGTLVAATDVILEFFWDGTVLDSYVDGVLQTRLAATNLPDDEDLTPSVQFLAGSAGAKTMMVDWVRVIQVN